MAIAVDDRDPTLDSPVARRVRDASPRGVDLVARLARAGIEAKLFGQPLQAIRVGRYEIVSELGTGGMGVVYLARDPELDREIALKLLRPAGATRHDPETSRNRLLREARAMARLNHPNVLTVHEVGRFEDQIFVAMEYVQGSTLAQWLAQAERPWREVLEAFTAAGRGLAAAHDKGIVHRDFKPENVMVSDDGRVLVLDFGLARSDAPDDAPPPVLVDQPIDTLTLAGAIVGTPAYMAPEQYAGRSADARSDQFAFCVGLWEAIYRQRPFVGATLSALAQAVMDGDLVEPIGIGGRPAWLRRAIERGLAVESSARHDSMHALLDALQAGLRPSWHERWMPAAIGGLTLALGIGLMANASRKGETIDAPAPADLAASARRPAAPERDASVHEDATARDPTPIRDVEPASPFEPLDSDSSGSLSADADERPKSRQARPRRATYANAWCYATDDHLKKIREPTAALQPTFAVDDACWSCRSHRNPDELRPRIDQPDCQNYALCHPCPP